MAWCQDQDAALSFVKRGLSESDSDSPGAVNACKSYSIGSATMAVKEVASCMTRQQDVTAQCNEYARTELPKFLAIHWKGLRNKAKRPGTVGSLEPFSE